MEQRKRSARVPRPASCVACGQPATGYHFSVGDKCAFPGTYRYAPSCDSCRCFFRRTVLAKSDLGECFTNGACSTGESDRRCRACRLDSCIKGGMNPLLVGHTKAPDSSITADLTSMQDFQLVPNPIRIEAIVERMIADLLSIEEAHQRLRVSKYSPALTENFCLDSFVHGPSKIVDNFGSMCTMPYTPVSFKIFPIGIMIKERVLLDYSKFDCRRRKLWITHDIIYAVEFIKALPVYHLLDDTSKKVLLASAFTCSNFTSAFYSYRHKSDRTFYPDGTVMTWSRDVRIEQTPLSTRFHTAVIAAIKHADLDVREYALLKIIIICNPMLNGLTIHSKSVLSRERDRYEWITYPHMHRLYSFTKALVSYILARRGVHEGPAYFTKMVAVIHVLIELTSWMKGQQILATAMGLYIKPSPFFEEVFKSA